jgi:hypothetical protein
LGFLPRDFGSVTSKVIIDRTFLPNLSLGTPVYKAGYSPRTIEGGGARNDLWIITVTRSSPSQNVKETTNFAARCN